LVLGKEGSLKVSYLLANKYIKEGKCITATEVNKVLAFSGIKITQNVLNKMVDVPRIKFSNLDLNTIRSKKFLESIGTVRGKIQVPGVYI
jgi:Ca2+-binding EF-hand superfamily protein